jgi:hypothetical protein
VTDYNVVVEAMTLAALFDIVPLLVVSGGAPGVDRLGERWAREHAIPVRRYLPTWYDEQKRFIPSAGFSRNEEMCRNADALVAVWDGKSPGTKHCIRYAEKLALPVWIHRVKAPPISLRQMRNSNPYEE